jgi:uncharacterized protein YndB with AHSA1/START domain
METVHLTHRYKAALARVFAGWTDPDIARQWLFRTADGRLVRCEINASVGGGFTIVERRVDTEVDHRGTFVELDRPRRLVFDFWIAPDDRRKTRVSLDILPHSGGSELALTHDGVPDDMVERSRAGWMKLLGKLEEVL